MAELPQERPNPNISHDVSDRSSADITHPHDDVEVVVDFGSEGLTDEEAVSIVRHLASSSKTVDADFDEDPPTVLVLECNRLTRLPEEIGQLSSLLGLALNGNRLGLLPSSIGLLSALETLELSGNLLTALPPEIGNLGALQTLRLGGCRLDALPDTIGGLRSLRTLGLNCNHLSSLPAQIGMLTALRTLRLHANRLSQLPTTVGGLRSLESLALGGNLLETLPAELGALSSLHTLGLNCNMLVRLPDEIHGLSALQALTLDGNALTSLPVSIGRLCALRSLSLNGNRLEALPGSIGLLQSLQSLSAGSNCLTSLPAEIGALQSLRSLWLPCNLLSALPVEMEALSQLQSVVLTGNGLGGGLAVALRCKTLWIDARVACGPLVSVTRHITGATECKMPYLNFLQRATHELGEEGAHSRTLVVAFGVSGFDFGGVISRSQVAADALFVYDQRHSSYMRDDGELRAFLRRTALAYDRVGAIGSSQSAFGALHYLDCFDALLAISPLDAFVQSRQLLSAESNWLPIASRRLEKGSRHCAVTIHVAEDNFLDAQYASFCEEAQRQSPERWGVRVVQHPGAVHPAYPGDDAVREWFHQVVWRA